MNKYQGILAHIILMGIMIMGLVFNPQYSVFAAPVLTINPITWDVIGLDSNNVNVGPNDFPVGVRVCNTGDTPATNVVATFVWDSANSYINLRPGSLNPITLASLTNGECFDFYFEVVITRTTAAYDTIRQYHINVTADTLGTTSTSTRDIYVEHLVSQNRNSVLDVQLNGVSIAAGGTMNLVVGNTYTITLLADTATNGYEQIETFINFPNTIFQIESVTTTYTANAGTDPDAGTKLYADGCGWDETTRSCTGTGKYGGQVTVTYVVTIIGGGGTSQPLNTLIYDFSGSSYHYNSDFALSTRIANISDPATCAQQPIAQWTFNNTTAPSTGVGTLTAVGVSGPTYVTAPANSTNPAIAYTGWDNAGSANEYLQLAVSTVGYYGIQFSFGGERAGNQAPTTATVLYSSDGTTFTSATPNVTLPDNGTWTNFLPFDFSSVSALDSNPNATFRIYAFGGSGGTQANRAAFFDNVTVTGCALPAAINITKNGVINQTIVAPTNETNVGDHIDYTIVITNDGGVPLTNIVLTDTQADSLTCTPSLAGLTLLPGQSVTCTGYHTLTQNDFDTGSVTNTATANSDQSGPVSASTTQTLPQTPALSLNKTANIQTYTTVGQQVTYTYTLTNTGNVTLTAPYSVADNKTTVDCSVAASPLLPGASTTCTATYTITQADIDAGSLTNLATANATFGNTTVTSNQSSVTINYAALNIIKQVSTDNVNWNDTSVTVNVGDTVYYRILVQNTGNVTLTGFVVDDGMAACTLVRGPDSPGNNDANFDAGETWVYTCSVTAVAGTQNNTATADSNETAQDSDTASYFGASPSLSILKSETSTGPYVVGDTITYSIVVTNTGNITLTGVTVSDNAATLGTCIPTQPATLAPNATMTCSASHVVTQADIDNGSYVNTATAGSNQTPPASSTVTVNFTPSPALTILKSQTSSGPYAVGDTITYSIVVTNTGNITLTGVTVTDNAATMGTCTPTQPATLTPNATMTCSASHIVTQTDIDNGSYVNTATADSDQTPPSSSTVTVNFPANPSLSVLKRETSTGPYGVSDTITYSIVVTNTGNVTLTGVTLTDNSATIGTCTPTQPATLAPNATMTCSASHVVTQADVNNGSYVNTATADSDQTPPSSSTVTVNFTPAPALSVLKSQTSNAPYGVGDTITYSIVVTNTGNVTLTGVTLTDNSATMGTCTPTQPATLAPNAAMTCSASHVVTQADVDNGSYVNTAIADSDQTPPASSTVTITFVATPSLSVLKSETSTGPYSVGGTITYSIVVTNTGNITLTGVTVSDNAATLGTCTPTQPATLAPNATMTCSASHVVTQADVNNGGYVNTATAGSDQTPLASSTVTVNFTPSPALTILKSQTSSGPYAVGDTITYSIVVTNTGNITLTGVTVSDNSAALGPCTPVQPATLTPSATMTCSASHVVTQADINNGSYGNTATANSDQTPPSSSTVTVNFTPAPALSVLKSQTSSGPYIVGDTITYSIMVTNTGNITLTGVTVSDNSAALGSCSPAQPATLAPNAAMTCSASHTVTQADVNNGSYVNTATASSNQTPSSDSTVTVNFGRADLSLTKTVNNTTPNVSTNINFTINVKNSGPDNATGVVVHEALPSGFTYVSASASRGTYSNTTGLWQIGNLAVNETVTLTVTAKVNSSGSYVNTAEIVASDLIDPDSTPNNHNASEDDQSTVTISPQTPAPKPKPTPAPTPSTSVNNFLIPVTGFAPNVVTDMSRVPYATYTDTTVTLEIPSLSVNIPIVGVPKADETWNVSWLENQAGWLEGSAFPTWSGNSVLAGHVYLSNGKPGPFAKLYELKLGDQIIVHAYGQTSVYEVLSNAIVTPTDQTVMKHEEQPWLTLVTCTDYNPKTGTYDNRFIVRAVLIKVSTDK